MRRYNGVMRTTIAVVVRVFVRCNRDHFGNRLEVRLLTGRNVLMERVIKFLRRDDRNESGWSCLAIEAEHLFLICTACHGCGFGRLRVVRCDCSRLRRVLRVAAFGFTAGCNARIGDFGCFQCVRGG